MARDRVARLKAGCDGGRGTGWATGPREEPGIMAAPDLVNLSALIDDAKCFALVRQQR